MQIAEFAGGCRQLQGKHDFTQHSTWSTSFSGLSSAENRYQNLLTQICGTQKHCACSATSNFNRRDIQK